MEDQLPVPVGAQQTSPTSGAKAKKRNEVENRRRRVAELVLSQATQQEIAALMHVSCGTISNDLKAIRAEWRKEYREKINEAQDRALASLARDEKKIRLKMSKLEEDDHGNHQKYYELLLKIADRRSKILGSDAPTKIEAVASSREPIVIEYRDDWKQPLEEKTVEGTAVVLPETPKDGSAPPCPA